MSAEGLLATNPDIPTAGTAPVPPVLTEPERQTPPQLEEVPFSFALFSKIRLHVDKFDEITPAAFRGLFTPQDESNKPQFAHFDDELLSDKEIEAVFDELRATGVIAIDKTTGTDSHKVRHGDPRPAAKPPVDPIEEFKPRTWAEKAHLVGSRALRQNIKTPWERRYHNITKLVTAPAKLASGRGQGVSPRWTEDELREIQESKQRRNWAQHGRTTRIKFQMEPGEAQATLARAAYASMGAGGASAAARAAARRNGESRSDAAMRNPFGYDFIDEAVLQSLDESYQSVFQNINALTMTREIVAAIQGKVSADPNKSHAEAETEALNEAINNAVGEDAPGEVKKVLYFVQHQLIGDYQRTAARGAGRHDSNGSRGPSGHPDPATTGPGRGQRTGTPDPRPEAKPLSAEEEPYFASVKLTDLYKEAHAAITKAAHKAKDSDPDHPDKLPDDTFSELSTRIGREKAREYLVSQGVKAPTDDLVDRVNRASFRYKPAAPSTTAA